MKKWTEKNIMNANRIIDNGLGVEGAKAMSEMLQVNTALTSLRLEGEEYEYEKKNERD